MMVLEWIGGKKVIREMTDAERDARQGVCCSPAQMRIALHRAGMLDTVNDVAASDAEANIVWEYATLILRQSPLIDAMKGQAGMTDEQIDALFASASQIEF